jgi:hypothetical protein
MVMIFVMGTLAFSQVDPASPEYQSMKEQGLFPIPEQIAPVEPVPGIQAEVNKTIGGLLIPLDGTFTLAMGPNDDLSSGLITLPFDFCFYGDYYNTLYINNNGNISFLTSYSTYSPVGFPSNDYIMIAPFWGDVDTRNGLGTVSYKIEPTRFTVIWDNVGYFSVHGDLRNTFELIMTDGNDPLIGVGNNVAFSYAEMQWTTGDASNGVGGFGGFPATVGVNKGAELKYALVGRFDHPGVDYDGPGGNADGVSYLDNKLFTFDACDEDVIVVPDVPVSDWALFIGIGLIVIFAVIRFRRLV